jgi:hypothetical protein
MFALMFFVTFPTDVFYYCFATDWKNNIQLKTFDKVHTKIYQPKRSDNDRDQRPWLLSLLGLIDIVQTDIKS